VDDTFGKAGSTTVIEPNVVPLPAEDNFRPEFKRAIKIP
jgi:hypothetical protein